MATGHCIMVMEVEMPDPENEGMKKRGRVYVCDLAGTEPAGDIVYALYDKVGGISLSPVQRVFRQLGYYMCRAFMQVNFDDGTFEYKYKGPHNDIKKTKELQEQVCLRNGSHGFNVLCNVYLSML
jgi:hypothetical protein